MANAVFGKFIEDVTKHMRAIICSTSSKFQYLAGHPNYVGSLIINKNLTIVFHRPKNILIKKPIAIGFSILELSKNYMYISYYDCFKPLLKNVRILFSDTDSLFLCFKSKDRLSSLRKLSDIMDFSNYPPNHVLYHILYLNQLGYFKDETCSKIPAEFVGIRSKSYAIKIKNDDNTFVEKRLCKGVEASAVKKCIPYSMYRNTISTISSLTASMTRIRSKDHIIHIQALNKIAFSSFDSKRYLFNCGIHSVPYGSIEITKTGQCPFC